MTNLLQRLIAAWQRARLRRKVSQKNRESREREQEEITQLLRQW